MVLQWRYRCEKCPIPKSLARKLTSQKERRNKKEKFEKETTDK
jgi:hypothetical protein